VNIGTGILARNALFARLLTNAETDGLPSRVAAAAEAHIATSVRICQPALKTRTGYCPRRLGEDSTAAELDLADAHPNSASEVTEPEQSFISHNQRHPAHRGSQEPVSSIRVRQRQLLRCQYDLA
jgi:hypothetical protein